LHDLTNFRILMTHPHTNERCGKHNYETLLMSMRETAGTCEYVKT